MRATCVLVLFAASLALGAATALADPGGNSGAAHQCKQAPGKTGDCVSDAAQGGTVTAAQSAAKPGAAHANKGGNSGAAHQCQHGGWKHLVRANQSTFKNTGACVSYAAHGGTLATPTPKPSTPSTSKKPVNPGVFNVVTNRQP